MMMISPSRSGSSWYLQFVILATVLALAVSQQETIPVWSGSAYLNAVSFVCGVNTTNAPYQQNVVQAILPPLWAGVIYKDNFGDAALSVDWGEDPTMFHYDTVLVDFETGEVITELPLWNDNSNTTIASTTTSYYWRWWDQNRSNDDNTTTLIPPAHITNSDESGTITILHTYTQPGQYWPIYRNVVLRSYLNFTDWDTMSTTCDYQPRDTTSTSGARKEPLCDSLIGRPRVDIGTDGSCSIVWVSSSPYLSCGAIFSTSMLVVVGFIATWNP